MTTTTARPIHEIARDIEATWPNVHYTAYPYLSAMRGLVTVQDRFFEDDARGIIIRFLGNATTWRGEDARRIKAELRGLLK
jgi:hypothetical protein